MDIQTLKNEFRHSILEIADRNNAENVRVFGSLVRGEHTLQSDIDFLVHFKKGASLFDLVALNNELEELLKNKVDVISDRAIKEQLAPFIIKEAIPI